jgi:cobalt-zinc-cadmium efflux system protein
VSVEAVETAMREIAGVCAVHDLHVWSIGSENHALSAHVNISDIPASASDMILREINERLGREFGIRHTTIQFEHAGCETAQDCVIPGEERVLDDRPHSEHEHRGRTH